MERWQAERIANARASLDAFVRKAEAQIEHLHRMIDEARKARAYIANIESFDMAPEPHVQAEPVDPREDRPGRQFG